FATSRASPDRMVSRAPSTAAATASVRSTRWPAAAATRAIPRPIAPAPTTPTISGGLDTSATLEPRLSLLDERANTLGVVLGAAGLTLQLDLERELGVEVVSRARVEAALDQAESARR